jgi:hypothetical protein
MGIDTYDRLIHEAEKHKNRFSSHLVCPRNSGITVNGNKRRYHNSRFTDSRITMTPKSITCVGIGNMGAALARALLTGSAAPATRSPNLILWNRTPDRPQVRALVEQGAVLETNLATAVVNSEVVVICLLDYPSVMAVFSALEGGQGGKILNP